MKRSCWLAAQCDAQHYWIGVLAIDDDAAPAALIIERSAHRPGLAPSELRHGIEQVCEAGQAVRECHADLRVARIGMARGHYHSGRYQPLDELRRGHFRGQGHQRASTLE